MVWICLGHETWLELFSYSIEFVAVLILHVSSIKLVWKQAWCENSQIFAAVESKSS